MQNDDKNYNPQQFPGLEHHTGSPGGQGGMSAEASQVEVEEQYSSVTGIAGNKKIFVAIAGGLAAAIGIFMFAPEQKTQQQLKQEEIQKVEEKKTDIVKDAQQVVQAPENPIVVADTKPLEPPPLTIPEPPSPPPAPTPIAPNTPTFPQLPQTAGGVQPPSFNQTQGGAVSATGIFNSKEEEEKKRAALAARRKSGIMVVGGGGGASSAAGGGVEGAGVDQDGKPISGTDADKDKDKDKTKSGSSSGSKSNTAFLGFGEGTLNEAVLAKTSSEQVSATYIGNLNSMIAEGKIIDAVVETAINTDLPGTVRAIVARDVYAESGKSILIPKGSRLIGEYSSEVKTGQVRVSVIWGRLIRPDGIDLALDAPGTDSLGRAGLSGHLDNKFWTRIGAAFLVSYIIPTLTGKIANVNDQAVSSTTTTNTDGSQSTTNNSTVGASQLKESADKFRDIAAKVVEDSFSSKPTITIDQGARINIFVNKDLVFPSNFGTNGTKVIK